MDEDESDRGINGFSSALRLEIRSISRFLRVSTALVKLHSRLQEQEMPKTKKAPMPMLAYSTGCRWLVRSFTTALRQGEVVSVGHGCPALESLKRMSPQQRSSC